MKKKILSLAFSALVIFGNCLCMEMVELSEQSLALFNAIRKGSYQDVSEIVTKDPKTVHSMRGAYSPLMKACIYNQVEIAQLLIANGANPDQHDSKKRLHPIHLASSVEMMELLDRAGADINARCEYNSSAFMFCATNKRYDCIRWLLEKKVVLEGDILERINNNKYCFKEHERAALLQMLLPAVMPDTCCVCFEDKKWPEIRLLPCYHLYGEFEVVNHLNACLCNTCFDTIQETTNTCPLCRKDLKKRNQ